MQCPHCFREVNPSGACPYCGYDGSDAAKRFPQALRPGSVLNGRYILGHVLGQGGFGITYIAWDDQTKERVAIKEYFPSEFAGRTGISVQVHSENQAEYFAYGKAQFLEEAKTLASFIGNAGIVRIYSFFEENGTAYFCMEYVDGQPLHKYTAAKGGRLTPEETNSLLLPLMGSMSVVHAKGIVHRDIAPDNILVLEDGRAKLIDFGAARYSTGEKSKSLDVILKHGFAPYEQYMRRGRQGPWTDVYAMAATWYYAVTGRIPPESVERMQEDTLMPPSALGVKIDAASEKTLMKALAVSAADRYQTMGEFCHAMMAASDTAHRQKARAAQRETPERRTKQTTESRPKKSKLPLILGIAALALALTLFGIWAFTGKESPAAAEQESSATWEELFAAAEAGDADAMLEVGTLYENGFYPANASGPIQDYEMAMEWYEKAAEAGNPEAYYKIGWLHYAGHGVKKDYADAMKWFDMAAKAGNTSAMFMIGEMYRYGYGVEANYAEALKWYEKAADNGDIMAVYEIGTMYENGKGVETDLAKALDCYETAARAGIPEAMYRIGSLYEWGIGVEKDQAKADEWYAKAKAAGYRW